MPDKKQSENMPDKKQSEKAVDRRALFGAAGAITVVTLAGGKSTAQDTKDQGKKKKPGPMDGVPPELVKLAKEVMQNFEKRALAEGSIKTLRLELKLSSPDMPRTLIVQSKPLSENNDPYVANPNDSDDPDCD